MSNLKKFSNRIKLNSNNKSLISPDYVNLDKEYFEEKGGILNGLTIASAQYIFKVIEKYASGKGIKRFDKEKIHKLRRSIIHQNAHLDEYFAELLFRSILPKELKDLEIKEHTLISKENDLFAKISWPNAVVFGIGAEDTGGAQALEIFDEHRFSGTGIKPSCSQMVAEEYLGESIPSSIQIVLNEVNTSDSRKGAHPYNLNILIKSMHDTLFLMGKDADSNLEITKYLNENWKRAIIGCCITSMVYSYEKQVFTSEPLDDNIKREIDTAMKNSLGQFLRKSLLNKSEYFKNVRGKLFNELNAVGSKSILDKAIWKDENGKKLSDQILALPRICYALIHCWGRKISDFVMMQIWQVIFQEQIMFQEMSNEIKNLSPDEVVNTKFGSVKKVIISNTQFTPTENLNNPNLKDFNNISPFWILEVIMTVPDYFNAVKVIKNLLNKGYTEKGNKGFGLILLHDKTINSKVINIGPAVPSIVWEKISASIKQCEPDRWFQLKDATNRLADFILNRTKSHQELLPSNKIDVEYLKNLIINL